MLDRNAPVTDGAKASSEGKKTDEKRLRLRGS